MSFWSFTSFAGGAVLGSVVTLFIVGLMQILSDMFPADAELGDGDGDG